MWWLGFNAYTVLVVLVFRPLPLCASFAALLFAYRLYADLSATGDEVVSGVISVVLFPLLNFAASAAELLVVVAIKWLLIGRFQEGHYPFYGEYHFKWVTMMVVMETLDDVLDLVNGSRFSVWVYRLFGASVGADCCVMGSPLEFVHKGQDLALSRYTRRTCEKGEKEKNIPH